MTNEQQISIDQAGKVGARLGLDWTKVDRDQFRRGLEVEMEHCARSAKPDISDDQLALAGKAVRVHLEEFPDYYLRSDQHGAEADDDGMARADQEQFHQTPAVSAGRKGL